jgi:flavin-binding protein dodecin
MLKAFEQVGVSSESWQDAVSKALAEVSKGPHTIVSVALFYTTARVEQQHIVEYHATIKCLLQVAS